MDRTPEQKRETWLAIAIDCNKKVTFDDIDVFDETPSIPLDLYYGTDEIIDVEEINE